MTAAMDIVRAEFDIYILNGDQIHAASVQAANYNTIADLNSIKVANTEAI